ncbi:carboxypeptidase-like regulatory domain-containing protein [Lewinella sp. LCG006]|uniref:carboxypeptidase-like regulatory domain-containing protein n=1 Tax=Lewinella sp. LCG006 TaxID=3231911 RepID=UPI0034616D70
MKTNIILLVFLLTCSLSWSAFSARKVNDISGCVVNEAGQAMLYVDVKDESGKVLTQTDVNGCFVLAGEALVGALTLYFPGYDVLTIDAASAKAMTYTLPIIKHLPAVYTPTGNTLYPTESRGEYEITGHVQDESKEALIGATVLVVGTTMGTVVDVDGNFKLMAPAPCVDLTIYYTGFETLEVKNACEKKKNTFTLKAGVRLDEVVVTGLSARRADKKMLSISSYAEAEAPMTPPSHSAPPPPPPSAVFEEGPALRSESYTTDAMFSTTLATSMEDSGGTKDIVAKGIDLPSAGQLTAGEINDFSKWDMWADISKEDLGQYRSQWQQFADHRYTLQLTTPSGAAVVNAIATLEDGQGNALWQARTDAQGRAELWAHYFRDVDNPANELTILINYEGQKKRIAKAKPFNEGINFETIRTDCREEAMVDIAFVVDATGSMGDEISYLQAELLDVIRRVREGLPGVDLQLGSVFYRDQGEEYLTRVQAFTKESKTAVSFVEQQQAQGGGDYPEAVEAALESALDSLQWRDAASTRLLFLVLDAPPHQEEENIKRMQVAITKAAQRGIQIIPVSCSGVDKNTEFLLRSMALATNGTYTFITDHSGIGNSHIEPSTDSYEVEYLNDVLARLSIDRSKLSTCETPIAETTIDEPADRGWTYYPNPTSGPISLNFTDTPGTLYLADAQGKLLLQQNAQDQFDMDLGRYPAGTYWLRHEAQDGTWTQGQVLLLRR